MKKITLLLSLVFLTFSCSSDDDDGGSSSSDLIGTWVFVSDSADGELIDVDPCELMGTLTYTADMATRVFFTSVEGECQVEGGDVFSYTANGNIITSVDENGDTFIESYFIDGTTLTLTNVEEDGPDNELITFVEVYEKQ